MAIIHPIQLALPFEGKACTRCRKWQPLSNYSPTGRGGRYIKSECKTCSKLRSQRFRKRHPEKIVEWGRQWRAKNLMKHRAAAREWGNKNKERKRANMARWYAENREQQHIENRRNYLAHREERIAYTVEWCRANTERKAIYEQRRRAWKKGSVGIFTLEEWQALKAHYGHICLCCHRSGLKLCADHIVPLSKGGANVISNIQPLCRPCNSRKQSRVIDYRTLGLPDSV